MTTTNQTETGDGPGIETLQQQLDARLQAALRQLPGLPDDFSAEVTPAADTRFGDYQTNAAMLLARPLRKNPREIAAQIVEHLDVSDLSEEPSIAGAGFINFTVTPEALDRHLRDMLQGERLQVPRADPAKTIVVDFSSPNVAKPMHIGHIRSTLIGDALVRVARFLGHNVVTDNHIGDWGTQFGMIIYGWKHHLDRENLASDPVGELVRVYRHVNQLCEDDHAIREQCKVELVKLQQGDPENKGIWEETIALSLQEFEKSYELLDIRFDHVLGESFYNDELGPLCERLVEKGVAKVSADEGFEGVTAVYFPNNEKLADKPCMIRKSDGGFLYATTDLATLEYRICEFGADEIWVVVGAPQALHFEQVNAVAEKMGIDQRITHVAFGSILGEDGKLMRTRSGDSVKMADVLSEAIERARAIVDEKNPDLPEDERREIGKIVGIGSVKYAELSQQRLSDYVFSWDKMLSLQGNTAPYLFYVYVRTRGIFRKAEGITLDRETPLALAEEAEIELAKKLAQFGETVPAVLVDHRPNILANYLYDLARSFHTFFEKCPVLRSEGTTLNTRLALTELTGQVLKHGLFLLGIQVPERM